MKKLSATTSASSCSKVSQDRAGVAGRDEQQEQPADPLAYEQQDARQAVRNVERLGPAETLDVLGGLGLEHIGDVVLGDDPEQAVLVVDNRDRQQVPLGQQAGRGLLVRSQREHGRWSAPSTR